MGVSSLSLQFHVFLNRHCERSEAIQQRQKNWIASSLWLLAMTKY
jgi:hypothetical protein